MAGLGFDLFNELEQNLLTYFENHGTHSTLVLRSYNVLDDKDRAICAREIMELLDDAARFANQRRATAKRNNGQQ